MKRRQVALLAALLSLAALLLAPSSALAAGTKPLVYLFHDNIQIDQPVEQQTDWPFPADHAEWTINPLGGSGGGCAWDVDDHWLQIADGVLDAGASLTVNECMVADATSQYVSIDGLLTWWSFPHGSMGVRVTTKSPDLAVSVCYAPLGRCLISAPRWVAADRLYEYASCSREAYYPGDTAMAEIPGSQGGVGRVSTITVTVRNPTSRAVRDVHSSVEVVPVHASSGGCSITMPPEQQSYPLTWSTT